MLLDESEQLGEKADELAGGKLIVTVAAEENAA